MLNWLYITMTVLGGIGIGLCVIGIGLWFRYENNHKRLQQMLGLFAFCIGIAIASLLLWDLRNGAT
ncbi:MAG: hypothetical protein KJZ65_09390 [Phycisphaerales bacterium]|nr:hypothetical protein [Phycisphaerales bacterium]